jgi:hypothetical protein
MNGAGAELSGRVAGNRIEGTVKNGAAAATPLSAARGQ